MFVCVCVGGGGEGFKSEDFVEGTGHDFLCFALLFQVLQATLVHCQCCTLVQNISSLLYLQMGNKKKQVIYKSCERLCVCNLYCLTYRSHLISLVFKCEQKVFIYILHWVMCIALWCSYFQTSCIIWISSSNIYRFLLNARNHKVHQRYDAEIIVTAQCPRCIFYNIIQKKITTRLPPESDAITDCLLGTHFWFYLTNRYFTLTWARASSCTNTLTLLI